MGVANALNTGALITLGGTLTTAGALTTVGAFGATFNFSGTTNVTFPTSGTLATSSGASIPSVAQGDLLYGSAANVLSTLTKDTNATRYLSNTGTSNNPAWAQVALATGVSGVLPSANGGTGVNNGSSTITLGGSHTLSGAFASTFTFTNTTSVTFPTSGTLATTSQIPAGAALTKTDDTNVTLTLGGSPTTALVNAASLTLGWTGTLAVTRGGTGDASFTAYSVLCGGTTSTGALQNVSGVGSSGQVLTSNGAAALPTWQPATAVTGSIVQVVSATFTSTASSSSLTFADTGLTATITPSSSTNKILVIASVSAGADPASNGPTFLNIVRGASNILVGDTAGSRTSMTCQGGSAATGQTATGAICYLDSPATTSATTYKVQFAASNGAATVYINRTTTDGNTSNVPRCASSIILMEVKA